MQSKGIFQFNFKYLGYPRFVFAWSRHLHLHTVQVYEREERPRYSNNAQLSARYRSSHAYQKTSMCVP